MEKPVIKVPLTTTDKVIEVLGYLALVSFWMMTIAAYSSLPDAIPIHYNAMGEVDGYGGKGSIFILPVVGTLLFLIITAINESPESFNYNVTITPENAESQYRNATRMMRVVKLMVALIFIAIDYHTIRIATTSADGLGAAFLPIVLGLFVMVVLYFVYQSYRLKQKSQV